MPTATDRDVPCHYERAGSGESVALVPTLGYGPWQSSWQFPALAGPFEAIAPVLRGTPPSDRQDARQGSAESAAGDVPDSVDVRSLADDLEAVLADAGARRAHLVGFGLGGHVALDHAARYDRARSLVLIATTTGLPEATPPTDVVDRLYAPRDDSDALRSSLDAALSEEFRERHADVLDGIVEWRAEEDADRAAWTAQAAAFEHWEREWPPYEVTEPTLVCQGTADEVVAPENAAALGELLPRASVERFDGAGHLVTVERSRPLNDSLLGFLERHASVE